VAHPDWPVLSGLAVGLLGLLEAYVYSGGYGDDRPETILLTLGATLPLTIRDVHLRAAAAITTLATLLLISSGARTPETVAVVLAQACVLYRLAERWSGWITVLLGVAFVLLAVSSGEVVLSNLLLLAAGIGALGVGSTRRLGDEVSEVRAEQAALQERARIARELHDVVAHHVSTIAIQADAARLGTPGLPAEGEERLEAIGQTARDAMTEMRRILGVLRTGDHVGELSPQPGLDGLWDLLETARATGTPVRLILDGPVAPLAPGVELTAYRIVQEALTNARRHAPGAPVEVALHFSLGALTVRVRDHGPGSMPADGGQGIRGMGERVAIAGGRLRTGPAEGGGFLVEADLPT
jgi:signal transduction histidine kinase